jgi:5-methylcytosine-specific restriction protein B
MKTGTHADHVREYARREYIEPARRRGESTVRIVAGDVQKAVKLSNRAALVCQALRSHKFLKENRLVLEKWEGPPGGVSTTVKAVYRLEGEPEQPANPPDPTGFLKYYGIAKEVYESLGGGEAFIRSEREAWGSGEDM